MCTSCVFVARDALGVHTLEFTRGGCVPDWGTPEVSAKCSRGGPEACGGSRSREEGRRCGEESAVRRAAERAAERLARAEQRLAADAPPARRQRCRRAMC